MTTSDILMGISIVLGVIALGGIAVFLWSACALAGRIDDEHDVD